MKKLIFGFIFLLAGALFLASCIQDNFNLDLLSDEMETEPVLNLPLLFGGFDMDDLVEVIDEEDYSLEDEDGERYYLVYPDTIYWLDETVDYDTELDQDVITYVRMTVPSVNELAIRMALQIFFEDENHVVIGSLFDNGGVLLEPAQIDSDGKLIEASEDENSSTFDADKIDMLDDVAYLRVRAGMHAAKGEEDFIKIYASYALNYEIALTANARINTGDLN